QEARREEAERERNEHEAAELALRRLLEEGPEGASADRLDPFGRWDRDEPASRRPTKDPDSDLLRTCVCGARMVWRSETHGNRGGPFDNVRIRGQYECPACESKHRERRLAVAPARAVEQSASAPRKMEEQPRQREAAPPRAARRRLLVW